jgi:hypothetical protein
MLQLGTSRELLERCVTVGRALQPAFFFAIQIPIFLTLSSSPNSWAADPKNGIILAGYAVEGTLAKELVREPKSVMHRRGKHLRHGGGTTERQRAAKLLTASLAPRFFTVHEQYWNAH